jgi:hypothetical protein
MSYLEAEDNKQGKLLGGHHLYMYFCVYVCCVLVCIQDKMSVPPLLNFKVYIL